MGERVTLTLSLYGQPAGSGVVVGSSHAHAGRPLDALQLAHQALPHLRHQVLTTAAAQHAASRRCRLRLVATTAAPGGPATLHATTAPPPRRRAKYKFLDRSLHRASVLVGRRRRQSDKGING